jgi:hypothetical protein
VKLSRSLAVLAAGAALTIGLAACTAIGGGSGNPTPSSSAAGGGVGATASWASPVTTPGSLITTVTGTNFKVDIFQVGTALASKPGQFMDPQTGKPIISAGDKIVYVNYVFTNTGTSTIPLGNDLAGVEPRYSDWPYLQGMDSVADADQAKTEKVNLSAFGSSAGAAPFEWKAGTSFSYGEDFPYESDSAISFTVTMIPVLASGNPDVAKKQIITASSTVK